jgi:hypothetical protein
VITDFGAELAAGATAVPDPPPGRSPSTRACWPYREAIELGLSRGRNAMAIWQDLCGHLQFRRRLPERRALRLQAHPIQSPEACVVIETAPGEEARGVGQGKLAHYRPLRMCFHCIRHAAVFTPFRMVDASPFRSGRCCRILTVDNPPSWYKANHAK